MKIDNIIQTAKLKDKTKLVTVSARINTEFHDELLMLCNTEKLAVNGLIKALLIDFIETYKKEKTQ